jgi:hypothetical protein
MNYEEGKWPQMLLCRRTDLHTHVLWRGERAAAT